MFVGLFLWAEIIIMIMIYSCREAGGGRVIGAYLEIIGKSLCMCKFVHFHGEGVDGLTPVVHDPELRKHGPCPRAQEMLFWHFGKCPCLGKEWKVERKNSGKQRAVDI